MVQLVVHGYKSTKVYKELEKYMAQQKQCDVRPLFFKKKLKPKESPTW